MSAESTRRIRRQARRGWRSGGVAVEMAMVAPVFLACLFGVFELGWALHCGATVRFAVERSARMLITNPDTTTAGDIQTAAQNRLNGVPISNLQITLDRETISTGEVFLVSWRYGYTMSLPYVPQAVLNFDSSTVVPVPGD